MTVSQSAARKDLLISFGLTILVFFAGGNTLQGQEQTGNAAAKGVGKLRKFAEQGDAGAQFTLGYITQNDAERVMWYRKAAEQEHAQAQDSLGRMYANGEGVAEDDAEAVKWFHKAAEQGHRSAQYNLGVMYVKGEGAGKDDSEAVKHGGTVLYKFIL